MAQRSEFKRIVLGVPYHRSGPGIRLAAEIARLLQLDLFGLFVEEESLLGLVALPFVREFQLLGGGWRPLDLNQLSHDLRIAARKAEKEFTEAVKTLQTKCQFEVVRGSMARTIASISHVGDIVVLSEPASPTESATPHFIGCLDAAFRSSAAVLLVPDRIVTRGNAIVAIAAEPQDPAIEAAAVVAHAAKEDLVIIETFQTAGTFGDREPHLPSGLRIKRVPAAQRDVMNASAIAASLAELHGRLLVKARGDNSIPSLVASMRHIPILIVESSNDRVEREGQDWGQVKAS